MVNFKFFYLFFVVTISASELSFDANEVFTLQVDANDDTQVVSVDLFVNGSVIASQSSFPFDFDLSFAIGGTVMLQGRAFDSGGSIGLSNVLSVDILQDITPIH